MKVLLFYIFPKSKPKFKNVAYFSLWKIRMLPALSFNRSLLSNAAEFSAGWPQWWIFAPLLYGRAWEARNARTIAHVVQRRVQLVSATCWWILVNHASPIPFAKLEIWKTVPGHFSTSWILKSSPQTCHLWILLTIRIIANKTILRLKLKISGERFIPANSDIHKSIRVTWDKYTEMQT
jgi:hypothetical protein